MSFLATLGGIATGAADFLSPILGYKSNKETNNANKEIAQMNNEWSERMMEKQNAMNIDQWNREKQFALEQRDYDSATQQASRLRAAGLNPNLVMSGQNAGSAASTPSGSSVGLPSPSSATMQPYDFSGIGKAFESSLNMIMALNRNEAEVNNLESQSNYNNALANTAKANEYESKQRGRGHELTNDNLEKRFSLENENLRLKNVTEEATAQVQKNLATNYKALTSYNEALAKGVPEELAAKVALLKAQKSESEFRQKEGIRKIIEEYEKTYGKLPEWTKQALYLVGTWSK